MMTMTQAYDAAKCSKAFIGLTAGRLAFLSDLRWTVAPDITNQHVTCD
jgi:hypothetical protein